MVLFCCLVVFLVGCAGPRFGNEEQYNKGEWKGYAYENEVARIKSDKSRLAFNEKINALAVEKLKTQPVDVKSNSGAVQGYKGVLHNLYSSGRVNIIVSGPERKSYFLNSGERIEDFLLPGKYCATFFTNGRKVGEWKFAVGVQQHQYMGQKVHWYLFYDP
jgi:hypothetical protein